MRKNCLKFTIQHKTLIRLGLCAFIRKFVAVTKNLKTNYTYFIKLTCFLLIQEKEDQ